MSKFCTFEPHADLTRTACDSEQLKSGHVCSNCLQQLHNI